MVRHTNKRRHTKRRRHTRRSQRGGGWFDNLFSSKKPGQAEEEEAAKKECDAKLEAIKKKYSGAAEGTKTYAPEGANEGFKPGAPAGFEAKPTENLANKVDATDSYSYSYSDESIENKTGGRSRRHRRHRRK